jgi:hypothetical protein
MKQIRQQATDRKLASRDEELDLRSPSGRALPY